MAERILAVFTNLMNGLGVGAVIGDLILTDQRACFVQLKRWSADIQVPPLGVASFALGGGGLSGLADAMVEGVNQVQDQRLPVNSLILDAEKVRGELWGMNIEQRLSKTRSSIIIPIDTFSFKEIQYGLRIKGARKRCDLYNLCPIDSSGYTSVDTLKASTEALRNTLVAWTARRLPAQHFDGYTCRFPAPGLLIDSLAKRILPEPAWNDADMGRDGEYVTRLANLFLAQTPQRQKNVIVTLQGSSHGQLTGFLERKAISSLIPKFRETLKKAISTKIGLSSAVITFVCGVYSVVLLRNNETFGVVPAIIAIFSFIPALFWLIWHFKLRPIKACLRACGINEEELEKKTPVGIQENAKAEREPLTNITDWSQNREFCATWTYKTIVVHLRDRLPKQHIIADLRDHLPEYDVWCLERDIITLVGGRWRGAAMHISQNDGHIKLNRIEYFIPSLLVKSVIFIVAMITSVGTALIPLAWLHHQHPVVVAEAGKMILMFYVACVVVTYQSITGKTISNIRRAWEPLLYSIIGSMLVRPADVGDGSD
jgi:hypothetical protein